MPKHSIPNLKHYRYTFSPKNITANHADPDFRSGPSTSGRKSIINSVAGSLIGEVVGEGINL